MRLHVSWLKALVQIKRNEACNINRCLVILWGRDPDFLIFFFPRCRSRPGSTTSAAPRRKRASTPRQCLTRTSSASSRGCRPSGWTSSGSSCPPTSRTTPRPRTRSPLVASPARTARGRCVWKNEVQGSKVGRGGVAWCGWEGGGGWGGGSTQGQM